MGHAAPCWRCVLCLVVYQEERARRVEDCQVSVLHTFTHRPNHRPGSAAWVVNPLKRLMREYQAFGTPSPA